MNNINNLKDVSSFTDNIELMYITTLSNNSINIKL